jgi:hypothetical protein
MLGWFKALMPKEERFFALFAKHAMIVVAGAEALCRALRGGNEVERYCRIVSELRALAGRGKEVTRRAFFFRLAGMKKHPWLIGSCAARSDANRWPTRSTQTPLHQTWHGRASSHVRGLLS